MKSSDPPGRTLPVAKPGDAHRHHEVPLDVRPHLREVHLGERRVVRAAARDQQLVDRAREVVEEAPERLGVGHVERRRARRADLVRSALEPLRVARAGADREAFACAALDEGRAQAGADADDDGMFLGRHDSLHVDRSPWRV